MKKWKKIVSAALAAAMVLSMTACGNSNSDAGKSNSTSAAQETSSKSDSSDGFVIGYPAVAATNTTMEAMKNNREIVAEAMGGSLITEEWDFSAEGTITAVEKLIERGCKGVIVVPTDESILPTITSMCEEAGVYWVISMRTIEDQSIKDIVYASDYYLGYVYEPGIAIGKMLAQAAADAGCKKYALITSVAGDTDASIREEGIAEVAKENNMECVGTVRGLSSAADATSAVESLIAANPDLDCIIRVTSQIAGDGVATCEALAQSGKKDDITFVSFNTEDGMEKYLEDGTCDVAFTDTNIFDSVMASTILCNKLVGTPVSDEKIELNLPYLRINSVEELQQYNKYINTTDDTIYSKDEVKEILQGCSLDDLNAIIDDYSISSIAARKSAQ